MTYVEEINPDEEGEANIQPIRRPKYVPPSKGKAKVPSNLDDVDSILIIPSLPKGFPLESMTIGPISIMKFEYWDLADTEKFPHLVTCELMEQSMEGMVTILRPNEWIQKVEEVELLYLLSIHHFLHPPNTILVIRQLLCLVHDEYLWIDKPIHITIELIYRILWLPCEGRDPMEIADKSGDVRMTKTMKKKYKMEKWQRGYSIDNISDKAVHIATQLLVRKVMWKCCSNEVPLIVVALVEKCVVGEWFNWVQFFCDEFLTNYRKVQEEGKTFHYVWLLFSIMLVTSELPEDSQFPSLDQD